MKGFRSLFCTGRGFKFLEYFLYALIVSKGARWGGNEQFERVETIDLVNQEILNLVTLQGLLVSLQHLFQGLIERMKEDKRFRMRVRSFVRYVVTQSLQSLNQYQCRFVFGHALMKSGKPFMELLQALIRHFPIKAEDGGFKLFGGIRSLGCDGCVNCFGSFYFVFCYGERLDFILIDLILQYFKFTDINF